MLNTRSAGHKKIMQILGCLPFPIATPDQKVFEAQVRASEASADEIFQSEIKRIEEEESRQENLEATIRETRKAIFKILPGCKNYRFVDGISTFLLTQGMGETPGEAVIYRNKYDESIQFQSAFNQFPILKDKLDSIRELFIKHNEYVGLLEEHLKKNTVVSSPAVAQTVQKPEASVEEKSDGPQTEFDRLFNCAPRISIARQGF